METGLRPQEHFAERLPLCIKMPQVDDLAVLARWKLPRDVFRRLFVDGSNRLATLDARTLEQLRSWRSKGTLAA